MVRRFLKVPFSSISITLSSSFDSLSFHGDTTFPVTAQYANAHHRDIGRKKYKAAITGLTEAAGKVETWRKSVSQTKRGHQNHWMTTTSVL